MLILRSLIFCAACVAIWQALLLKPPGGLPATPGLERYNAAVAERFVHDVPEGAVVIVGSSMANRLDDAQLGAGHAKLTFPSNGALTGLAILERSGRVPPVCWIETNMLLRGVDEELVEKATSGWKSVARQWSPAFRETGRPSGYGIGMARDVLKKFAGAFPGDADAVGSELFARETKDRIVAESEARLRVAPARRALDDAVATLAASIARLEDAGCVCVLFEMPMDGRLKDLAEPSMLRTALEERFPRDKFRWFRPQAGAGWQTTDGVHLTARDASRMTRAMLDFERGLPKLRRAGNRSLIGSR